MRFECFITKQTFEAEPFRIETVVKKIRYAWVWCPCCDCYSRPHTHPDYDAKQPQPHSYVLGEIEVTND